jgi:phosphoribosylformimino-5-aminoimidazole carboxamide ribotide isomerase
MIVMPAIDLRDGACVQLVGGSYDDERIRLPDPVSVAKHFEQLGFTSLHIVDLDAATDHGSNRALIRLLLKTQLDAQVGGGISTTETINALLRDGAKRIVIGTRAIEHIDWLRFIAQTYPRKVIVAADVRDRNVVTRGWRHDSQRHVLDILAQLAPLPLAGVFVTAVHREGRMCGPDLELVRDVTDNTCHNVYVAGGIASLADLRCLAAANVHAAIIGMALYTGALDPRTVASEFTPQPA